MIVPERKAVRDEGGACRWRLRRKRASASARGGHGSQQHDQDRGPTCPHLSSSIPLQRLRKCARRFCYPPSRLPRQSTGLNRNEAKCSSLTHPLDLFRRQNMEAAGTNFPSVTRPAEPADTIGEHL